MGFSIFGIVFSHFFNNMFVFVFRGYRPAIACWNGNQAGFDLNMGAALCSFVGLAIGILLGQNTNANIWIFAIAGGMFIYIALVVMVR